MTTSTLPQELVVVTGAPSGMGAASAAEFARRGFHVLAGVRRDQDAQAIRGDLAPTVIVAGPDLSHRAAEVVRLGPGAGRNGGVDGAVRRRGDAIGGPRLLGQLQRSRRRPRRTNPPPATVDVVPSKAGMMARGIAAMPGRRVRALRSAPGALAHLDQVPVLRSLPGARTLSQVVRGDLRAKRLDAPRTRFNAKLSAARTVAFGTVSLSDVKAIKNELGVTVNDVVIALCAGALRRRLTATGDLPTDPLVAYIPVSTGCQTHRIATATRSRRSSRRFPPTCPMRVTDSRSRTKRSRVPSSAHARRHQH